MAGYEIKEIKFPKNRPVFTLADKIKQMESKGWTNTTIKGNGKGEATLIFKRKIVDDTRPTNTSGGDSRES